MTSKQVEPDNDTSELDDDFGTFGVPSISEARAALKIEYFRQTKYNDTDDKRKALFLLGSSVDAKYNPRSNTYS